MNRIIQIVLEAGRPMISSEVATAADVGIGRAREVLAKAAKDGLLVVGTSPDNPKVKTFAAPAQAESKPAKTRKAKADAKPKADRWAPRQLGADSARGKPNAKKIVNPQATLEAKKLAVVQAGGSMTWARPEWSVEVGEKAAVFSSRALAALSLGEFCAQFDLELPTVTGAAPTSAGRKRPVEVAAPAGWTEVEGGPETPADEADEDQADGE